MNAVAPRENRVAAAVGLMLVTFLSFSMLDAGAKYLVTSGFPSMQVVFTRYLGHFIMIVVFYFPRHGTAIFKSNAPGIQSLRALALLAGTVTNFIALVYLPLTVTTAIIFAAPLAVCLLSYKFLGEAVGTRRLSAVFVGFLGVLVITQVWNSNFHWAMFLSIGTFLCASVYFVLTRKLAGTDNLAVSQVYASGVATVVLVPFGYMFWVMPTSALDWVMLFVIGVFGAFGHSLLTLAHRFAQASTLAPLIYVQIIYATILSWLIFNTIPDFWTLVGAGIIIASGLYIWLREKQIAGR